MANEKFKKNIKPTGKYYSNKSDAELRKFQFMRTIFLFAAIVLYVTSIFIKQNALAKLLSIVSLATLYATITVVALVISVFVIYYNFVSHKIRREFPDTIAPKKGFDKRTFFPFELFMVIYLLTFVMQFALMIYSFDLISLLTTFINAAAAVFAVLTRITSFRAFHTDLTYVPPVGVAIPSDSKELGNKNLDSNLPDTTDSDSSNTVDNNSFGTANSINADTVIARKSTKSSKKIKPSDNGFADKTSPSHMENDHASRVASSGSFSEDSAKSPTNNSPLLSPTNVNNMTTTNIQNPSNQDDTTDENDDIKSEFYSQD